MHFAEICNLKLAGGILHVDLSARIGLRVRRDDYFERHAVASEDWEDAILELVHTDMRPNPRAGKGAQTMECSEL